MPGLQQLFEDWPQIAQSHKQEVSKLLKIPCLAEATHVKTWNFDTSGVGKKPLSEGKAMLITQSIRDCQKRRAETGMTLMEVTVSFAISLFTILGIVTGYVAAANAAERFNLSQAANEMALQRLEQTRCAQWITSVSPGVDQLQATNFTNVVIQLDYSGNEIMTTPATNITTITTISTTPALRKVHVDCVWSYGAFGTLMTNSIEMIRSPK
jgi:type II secretory pathway pseudopilin PulG